MAFTVTSMELKNFREDGRVKDVVAFFSCHNDDIAFKNMAIVFNGVRSRGFSKNMAIVYNKNENTYAVTPPSIDGVNPRESRTGVYFRPQSKIEQEIIVSAMKMYNIFKGDIQTVTESTH